MEIRYADILVTTFNEDTNSRMQSHALLGAREVAWELDLVSHTMYLSPNWLQFSGLDRLPSHPITWQSIIHPDDLHKIQKDWDKTQAKALAGSEDVLFENEHRIKKANGDYLWVSVKGSFKKNAAGKITTLFGTLQNEHERKLAELALQKSETKFSSAFTYASIGMALVSLDGRFIQANPALCDLLGYTESELLDLTFQQITHPEDLQKDLALLQELTLGKRDKYELEKRYYTKKGTIIWILLAVSCMRNVDGNPEYYIAQIQNINARKQYELQLIEARQQAELADQNKSDFLNTMAHEIRTPMNTIIGYTHLLLDEKHYKHQKGHLDAIIFTSKHLHSLVSDILDFNKLEAGKMELQNSNVNLKSHLKDILKAFRPQAEENNVTLDLNIHPAMPKEIVIDQGQLQLAITNLVSNAIKFTSKGSVKLEVFPSHKTDSTVDFQIDIIDTGKGIAKKNQSIIFENFRQLEVGIRKKHRGTGLGLSIVKKVIENMGGSISLKSVWRKGSTFSVTLSSPYTKADNLDKNKKPMKKDLHGYSILIAEDNRINLTMTTKFLEKWGAAVTKANDGKEAVEYAMKDEFSIILMDLQMPRMNGYEATEIILNSGNKSPIVALTAFCTSELKMQAQQHGMVDFITKPFNPDDLYKKILQYGSKPKKAAS